MCGASRGFPQGLGNQGVLAWRGRGQKSCPLLPDVQAGKLVTGDPQLLFSKGHRPRLVRFGHACVSAQTWLTCPGGPVHSGQTGRAEWKRPALGPKGGASREEVNYRKLGIGAGNRINAGSALDGGCGGAPTAQSSSVELRRVLLVVLQVAWLRGLGGRAAGSPERLQKSRATAAIRRFPKNWATCLKGGGVWHPNGLGF